MSNDPIFEAIQNGDGEAVAQRVRAEPTAARARDENGISAVLAALYGHHFELAELLREHAGPLDVFEAAAVGDGGRIRALVAEREDLLTTYGADGFTPLHLACYFARAETVGALLELGADANAEARNPTHMQPLHSAAAARRADLVERLLERGADANATQHGGWTALHAAARHADLATARCLCTHGADREQRAESGEAPRDLLPSDAPDALVALLERARRE